MTHPTRAGIGLVRLGDSDFVPENPEDDLRGKAVYDAEGQRMGSVDDLYIDGQEREVRFLEVGAGGFLGMGEKNYLVPDEAATQVIRDPQTNCPTPTPGCLTATLRVPRPPRLLVTGHPPDLLAGAMWEVTDLRAAETYLLPGHRALCR